MGDSNLNGTTWWLRDRTRLGFHSSGILTINLIIKSSNKMPQNVRKYREDFVSGFIITEEQQVPMYRTNNVFFFFKRNSYSPKISTNNLMTIFYFTKIQKQVGILTANLYQLAFLRILNIKHWTPPHSALI